MEVTVSIAQSGEGLLVTALSSLRRVLPWLTSNRPLLAHLALVQEEEEEEVGPLSAALELPVVVRPLFLDKAEVDYLVRAFDLLTPSDALPRPPSATLLSPPPPEEEEVEKEEVEHIRWSEIDEARLVTLLLDEVRLASCSTRFLDPILAAATHALEDLAKSLLAETDCDAGLLHHCDLTCPALCLRLPVLDYRRRLESEKGTSLLPHLLNDS